MPWRYAMQPRHPAFRKGSGFGQRAPVGIQYGHCVTTHAKTQLGGILCGKRSRTRAQWAMEVTTSAPNTSYFAFTATPKAKTFESFGRVPAAGDLPELFDLYSMQQTIDGAQSSQTGSTAGAMTTVLHPDEEAAAPGTHPNQSVQPPRPVLPGVRETPAFINDLFNDSGTFAELGRALTAMLYEYLTDQGAARG